MTFEVRGGERLAVTGSNGSGKSTLVRIVAGVLAPTRGQVVLQSAGQAVPAAARPFSVGLVAPYLNVYDLYTARENLVFVGRVRGLKHLAPRVEAMLDLVHLRARADERVDTYSSGMKQRVRLAAALLAEPPVLLLDEPTSNLDAAGIRLVEEVLAQQRERGGLALLATNSEAEAALCERRLCVEDFR